MSSLLNERFWMVPEIVGGTCRKTEFTGSGTTVYVTDGSVTVPNKPPRGLTYRFRAAGTKTGTNATHKINLVLGSTELLSIEADDTTAVDWMIDATVMLVNPNVQKAMGAMFSESLDCGMDYAAGAVDCTAGPELKLQVEKHTSDDVTVEMVTIEKWQYFQSDSDVTVTT